MQYGALFQQIEIRQRSRTRRASYVRDNLSESSVVGYFEPSICFLSESSRFE